MELVAEAEDSEEAEGVAVVVEEVVEALVVVEEEDSVWGVEEVGALDSEGALHPGPMWVEEEVVCPGELIFGAQQDLVMTRRSLPMESLTLLPIPGRWRRRKGHGRMSLTTLRVRLRN